jgi:hypothetical protein
MKRFLAAFSIAWIVLFAWGFADAWPFMIYDRHNWLVYAAQILGIPLGAAWIVTELIQGLTPRRLLDPRARMAIRQIGAGLFAGAASIGVALLGYATVGWDWDDVWVLGPSAGVSSAALLLIGRRVRPGRCMHCGYSTDGLLSARCPECGEFGG